MNGYMIMLENNSSYLTFGSEPSEEELEAIESEQNDD